MPTNPYEPPAEKSTATRAVTKAVPLRPFDWVVRVVLLVLTVFYLLVLGESIREMINVPRFYAGRSELWWKMGKGYLAVALACMLSLAFCFATFRTIRKRDPIAWSLAVGCFSFFLLWAFQLI